MNITKVTLDIGLGHEIRLLHATDNHFCYADVRDDERKIKLAEQRRLVFETKGSSYGFMTDFCKYSRENCDLLVHTGDLIDFVSHLNLEKAAEVLEGTDYFMVAGNHEFSKYVGEAWEDETYKLDSYSYVQRFFNNNILFDSRVVNGLNLVAIDNTYYHFTVGQLYALKNEVAKGLPIVLLLHNPIHTDALYNKMMFEDKRPCAYLTGTPKELMQGYDEYRYKQQLPSELDVECIRYIEETPEIKAIFTGHLHFTFDSFTASGKPQLCTVGGYKAEAREITIR